MELDELTPYATIVLAVFYALEIVAIPVAALILEGFAGLLVGVEEVAERTPRPTLHALIG